MQGKVAIQSMISEACKQSMYKQVSAFHYLHSCTNRCFSEKQDAIDDRNLSRMIHIYSWIKPEHLDIKFTETTETNPLLLTAQKGIQYDSIQRLRAKDLSVIQRF